MARQAANDAQIKKALLTALLFSAVALLAVVFVCGVRQYDIVTAAENAVLERLGMTASAEALSAEEGVAMIRTLEGLDPDDINAVLRARRQAELEALQAQREAELAALTEQKAEELLAMREQRLLDMMDGTINVWSMFDDYVLIGDSRVVGFSYYGFLPESRVIAELGATILGVSDKLWQIRQVDPSYIYLSFGANDLVSYLWPTGPEYAARYRQLVELLQSEFPYATIVVNSIPAITEPALHTQSIYYKVDEFNDSLRQMCEQTGAVFVDNDAVSAAHSDLYAGDGIHFDPGFYPYWGATMIEAVLEAEEGDIIVVDESELTAVSEEDLRDMEEFGLLD